MMIPNSSWKPPHVPGGLSLVSLISYVWGAKGGGGGAIAAASATRQQQHTVWPMPQEMSGCLASDRHPFVDLQLGTIEIRDGSSPHDTDKGALELRQLFDASIKPNIFLHRRSSDKQPSGPTLTIDAFVDRYSPFVNDAEDYSVEFPKQLINGTTSAEDGGVGLGLHNNIVSVRATTQVGVIRAFETITQLIRFDFQGDAYTTPTMCEIADFPRFPHRGLLIDTSRHYLPVRQIERILDQLRMNKLSVLHWHLTDAHSFPFASRVYPEIAKYAAYSEVEQYTVGDLRHLAEYARLNGVRIVVELDQPGHIGSLFKSHPELFACKPADDSPHAYYRVALNPTDAKVYDFMASLCEELLDIFPDNYFHIGTDEVPEDCWTDLAKASSFTANDLFGWYISNMTQRLTATSPERRIIAWDEAFLSTSPDNEKVAIQIWHEPEIIKKVLAGGFDAIASPHSMWYLSKPEITWRQVYAFDLDSALVLTNSSSSSSSSSGRVGSLLGGEGCMWGEHVDTSNFENTLWPRMSAIGEKLWSSQEHTVGAVAEDGTDMTETDKRLRHFRCSLNARGVGAAPIGKGGRPELSAVGGSCFQEISSGDVLPSTILEQ